MTTAAELEQLDDEELDGRLAEYRRELLNLRFQIATSQLDNPSRITGARRDIARVLTLMREREIALAEGRDLTPREYVAPSPRRPRADEELEAVAGADEDVLDVDDEIDEFEAEEETPVDDELEDESSLEADDEGEGEDD